ncbi:helix-turn-helix transcriptional regulator [Natribaculum luteum]|uniref:Helix-turn-helix transcriptional regulator n=1 Tax=Natribaculum luteum TaxID=1586232 RepID=A0ABD5NX58_9EURY|nr:hypothetical protein [Natribaculum luteum]
MYRSVLAGIVALILAVSVVSAGGSLPGASHTTADISSATLTPDSASSLETNGRVTAVQSQQFDSTTFEVTVSENGDSTWTFRHERQLNTSSDSNETDEYREFAEQFEEEETELYVRFTEQAQALTATGSNQTDRQMEATNFNRSAGINYRPNPMGYVEMSFTWTGFATVDDDGSVTVGDVFDGGLYIGPDQSFVVRPGDGLVFESAQPEGQYLGTSLESASSVTWNGEREFPDGQPRVVLVPEGSDGSDSQVDGNSSLTDLFSSTWLVAGLVVVALGLGGFAWYRFGSGASTDDSPDDGPAPDAASQRLPDGAVDSEADQPPTLPDESLMTDEDRVVKLIRDNGGRMKQVNIVEETGWSKSKVSMLLSDMEEEGTISKLRVGRENIISLDGFEPEATKSPFEE